MKKHRNLYLSPDEQPSVDVAQLDPLDTDVNQIDTSRPRLVASIYDLICSNAEIKEQKDDVPYEFTNLDGSTGSKVKMLALTFNTTQPAISTDRETINPGFGITHYITIATLPSRPKKNKPSEMAKARTKDDVIEDIAKLCKSAGISTSARSVIQNPAQLKNATFRCKVKIDKGNAEFGESNRIAEFLVRK